MHKKWSELTRAQRVFIVTAGGAELVLTSVAAVDLIRRPAAQVRGRKVWWALFLAVQPAGPVVYLLAHRRA